MTVVRTEKRQRGAFGKLIKWLFIGFNIVCAIWVASGLSAVSKIQTHSTAEQIGTHIGATIGFAAIGSIWLFGAILLGILVLLTRGDTVIIEEKSSAGSVGSSLGSNTDFSTADERIAEMLASSNRSMGSNQSTAQTRSATPGFGKRGVQGF